MFSPKIRSRHAVATPCFPNETLEIIGARQVVREEKERKMRDQSELQCGFSIMPRQITISP
jgi:hypothetical protein